MTALDPTPTLSCRREALDLLEILRERLADFLDRPSLEAARQLTATAQSFVLFETASVLPELRTSDFRPEQVQAVLEGHDALSARLNRLAWVTPGSAEVQAEAHQLRHEVLAQLDHYHAFRLPRGALLPSD